jgi:hypothetical protein
VGGKIVGDILGRWTNREDSGGGEELEDTVENGKEFSSNWTLCAMYKQLVERSRHL